MSRDESKGWDLSPEQLVALERLVRARTDGVFVNRPTGGGRFGRRGGIYRRTMEALEEAGYLDDLHDGDRAVLTEKAFTVARKRWWIE